MITQPNTSPRHPSTPLSGLARQAAAMLLLAAAMLLCGTVHARAAITYVNQSCDAAGLYYVSAGESIDPTTPSGMQVGDLMLYSVMASQTPSTPSGWTLLQNTGNNHQTYYRFATAADVSGTAYTSVTFAGGSNNAGAGIITAWRGMAAGVAPTVGATQATGSGSSVALPNATVSTTGSVRVSVASARDTSSPLNYSFSTASMTQLSSCAAAAGAPWPPYNRAGIAASYESVAVGTTASRTTTISSSGTYAGQTFILSPSGPPPVITSLSPSTGPAAGGTSVTITGTDLTGATSVTFGGTAAAGFAVVNATTITATAPARAAGTADVLVTTAGGTSANTSADDYTYVAAPTVTNLTPATGPATGGTLVTITGTNLTGATSVTFGATAAAGFAVVNATTITATAPARAAGTADVLVTTAGGTSANTSADDYVYVAAPTITSLAPSSGPTAGGTSVTITGTNLTGATAVRFGATNAAGYTVVNATTITATAPAGTGTVDVSVTTVGGTSASTAADNYAYVNPPTVTLIAPATGLMAGGTLVTITGTNLTGASSVTFGGTAATGYTVVNATTITATAPAHAAGTVDVRVTTPSGTSANTSADDYTYLGCSTGGMAATLSDVTFGALTLNGQNRTQSASTTVSVSDLSGAGAGWHLSIGTTQFDAGGGRTLPANAARIVSASAAPQAGSCAAPTPAFSSYPVTLPISPSRSKIYSASVGTGTGPVDVTLNAELDVPANTRVGTYQSTWTIDLAAAP